MILYTYFGQDPRKVVSLAQNCGIEAYRLINIEYDPVTAGMEFELLPRSLLSASSLARTSLKSMLHCVRPSSD